MICLCELVSGDGVDGTAAVTAQPGLVGREYDQATSSRGTGEPRPQDSSKKDVRSTLLGTWQCRTAQGTSVLVFESPARLNLDGQQATYSVVSNALRIQGEYGAEDYPFRLENGVLTITFPEGFDLQFARVSDKTVFTGEEYPLDTESEPGAYGEPEAVGGPPAPEAPAASDPELVKHFAGTWWSATTNTETKVTFTADGRYRETSTASYSGGSNDQSGNPDMNWGTANDQWTQGTWTVRGTREQGKLTLFLQNGKRRDVSYQVHVENGTAYWNEYYFNGALYGKKTK